CCLSACDRLLALLLRNSLANQTGWFYRTDCDIGGGHEVCSRQSPRRFTLQRMFMVAIAGHIRRPLFNLESNRFAWGVGSKALMLCIPFPRQRPLILAEERERAEYDMQIDNDHDGLS